ncbi:MAG: DUF1080 domain-containing protein [Phycisphaera sp. RhM]|nr:DUF1080 domain-containing protein [Phycisphaera sp. RhM]
MTQFSTVARGGTLSPSPLSPSPLRSPDATTSRFDRWILRIALSTTATLHDWKHIMKTPLPVMFCAFVFSTILSAGTSAADGFESIFDGESLKGWKALDMSYWSVRDGAITGQSTPEHPCTSNQFLVWQGGDVGDFEVKLKFRVTGNGCNSGVQFRSKIRPDGLAVGYQADIYQSGSYLGGVCDEMHSRQGPELLTGNGQRTVIDASGKRTATDLGTKATMKPWDEWNDYHITAKGRYIALRINGELCSELIDEEKGHSDLEGILGLQLRSGQPMTVQFKDIFLNQLSN